PPARTDRIRGLDGRPERIVDRRVLLARACGESLRAVGVRHRTSGFTAIACSTRRSGQIEVRDRVSAVDETEGPGRGGDSCYSAERGGQEDGARDLPLVRGV